MPVSLGDVLTGPSDVYFGFFLDATAVEPATPNTAAVAYDATAGTGWRYMGPTDGGVKIVTAMKYEQQMVDNVVDPLESTPDTRMCSVQFDLAKVTLENLRDCMNGGSLTVSGTGPAQVRTFEPISDLVANSPVYGKLLIRGKAPILGSSGGQKRDVFLRRTLQTDDLTYNQHKTEKSKFTVSMMGHYVSSTIGVYAWRDTFPAA